MKFKDLDEKKKKVLFIMVPVLLVAVGIFGYVIYDMFGGGGSQEVDEYDPFARLSTKTVDAIAPPLLDKEEAYRKAYNDSVNLANRDESIDFHRYEERRREDSLKKAEAQRKRQELFASLGIGDDVPSDGITDTVVAQTMAAAPVVFSEPVPQQTVQSNAGFSAVSSNSSVPKKSSGGAKKSSGGSKSSASKKMVAQNEDDGYGYYGFGVSSGGGGNQSSYSSGQPQGSSSQKKDRKLRENRFFEAFLIQDTRMKNGSQVTFILNQDVTINGIKFKKMSRIYGVCQFGSNVVNITTTTIQNTDGKKYPVRLTAYNENYQPGIYVSGIEDVLNQGTNETEENLIDEMNPNSKLSVVNTGIKAIARTTKKAVRKEQEISMSEGYKMYFPIEEEDL